MVTGDAGRAYDGSWGHPDMAGGGGNKCSCGESLLVDIRVGLLGGLKLRQGGHDLFHGFALPTRCVHIQNKSGCVCLHRIFDPSTNHVDGSLLDLPLDRNDVDRPARLPRGGGRLQRQGKDQEGENAR
ncbi:MAG: hypothetical protein EBT75_00410 [Proteobacteria bacterium]|nr:hypothetical protein [Pseudomonadota bacterium]